MDALKVMRSYFFVINVRHVYCGFVYSFCVQAEVD